MKHIPAWLIVTQEQYKQGWMELQDGVPVHRNYIQLGETEDGKIVVRNPELAVVEASLKKLKRSR